MNKKKVTLPLKSKGKDIDYESSFDEDSDMVEVVPTEITEQNLKEYADQLQFDTLVQECIVEDLCKSYSITKEDFMILVHEVKKRGNNIRIMNTTAYVDSEDDDLPVKTKITLIQNFGHKQLIDDLTYNIVCNDDNIKCMFISDLRFGSVYQQTTILNEMYSRAKALGVKYVFITGDVVEGMYTGARSIYNLTLHKEGYEDQARYVASVFPRVEGITTYFITGEHDLSFLKTKDKIDIGKLISSQREDLIYLGQNRRKVSFINEDNGGEISIYLQHAKGNVPYTISYKPQQKIASLRNEDKTDILVTGHFAACDAFLRRGIQSYQVPTVVATTDEMKDAHTPVYNTIGSWMVTLNRDRKGGLKNTSQIFVPYYKTIPNDYKTFKPLYSSTSKQVPVKSPVIKDDVDKIFTSIGNGESIDEVCEKLNISELKFGGLLEEFKLRDYDIDITDPDIDGVRYISKKRLYRSSKPIKTPTENLTKISLLVISDTHLCNEAQQLNFLNTMYKEAYERGITTVLNCGDLLDGDYKNRPEHQYALFRQGASRQINYLAEYYPKIDGMDTYFITGTHDQTHEKNGGTFTGPEIEQKRPDLHFLGDDMGMFHPVESPKTNIQLYHPGGGCASSLSYKMQKYIDKMEPGNKPNILFSGHFHQSHMMAYRNVIAGLIPCLTDKTSFAIRQGLENTMGGYFVDLYVNSKGEVEMFGYEEKRFSQKDCKKDDWLKTRKLVIK